MTLANLKVRTTQDEVRKKALKAFRDLDETQAAIKIARELVALHAEAVKKATTPEAMKKAGPLLQAGKKIRGGPGGPREGGTGLSNRVGGIHGVIGDH